MRAWWNWAKLERAAEAEGGVSEAVVGEEAAALMRWLLALRAVGRRVMDALRAAIWSV